MQRIFAIEASKHIDEQVKVCGWVSRRRDHGKVIFIDLRDKSDLVQIVFAPDLEPEVYQLAEKLRAEWVIEVIGEVKKRPKGMENPKIATGSIEIKAKKIKILTQAKTLPFSVQTSGYDISEKLRLKYRYLDIRRQRLQENLRFRHQFINLIRNWLSERGFVEIETPILTKSTPEGARDYIVPSRLEPGKFYALPQSPQQYKQLLMVAGIEKYFQIARCFRDEDTRGDRQPEFTQLDLEMDFPTQEDILRITENLFKEIIEKIAPEKKILQFPFPRITYEEAIRKYNSDKPDLRPNKSDKKTLAFLFVCDFPLFEWKKEERKWGPMHHPFTRPKFNPGETMKDVIKRINKEPERVIAHQYDIVLNGSEIGGGSLRIHESELLEAIFEFLGHKKEAIHQKFGHLLEAFTYGAPPHGGIALGLDRILMALRGENSIREVIAFPKTGDGKDLMMQSPAEVSAKQLKELHLEIKK
ncbi:aspartate--tRNA ligase [bacterium]|nr:aspartate--tRNA ligase [bacterium]